MKIEANKIKIRREWVRKPIEKVKASNKLYNRAKTKREIKKERNEIKY